MIWLAHKGNIQMSWMLKSFNFLPFMYCAYGFMKRSLFCVFKKFISLLNLVIDPLIN